MCQWYSLLIARTVTGLNVQTSGAPHNSATQKIGATSVSYVGGKTAVYDLVCRIRLYETKQSLLNTSTKLSQQVFCVFKTFWQYNRFILFFS